MKHGLKKIEQSLREVISSEVWRSAPGKESYQSWNVSFTILTTVQVWKEYSSWLQFASRGGRNGRPYDLKTI